MVIESPVDPRVLQMIDRSFAAARASLRPLEFRSESGELVGGHYRIGMATGLTTILNAGDAILSARFASKDRVGVLLRLKASATISTAFGTAQETSLDVVKVNNFAAVDTGGTSQLPLGNSCRKSAAMQPADINDLRVATTLALGLGSGSVADAKPFGFGVIPVGNAVGASASEMLFDAIAGVEHPMVLANNEGFRARLGFTQGATGVVRFTFVMDWAEVPIF
jgi:hypothetical protein